jgi:uncharacterized hydrophobic protein (TIGR00271 family)
MHYNPKDWFLVQKWRQLKDAWAPYRENKVPAADLALPMGQASLPSFSYFAMLALAAAIATLGLLANSAPTIIGAMIIAPLMAPIISLSYGLVGFEKHLIVRSILTVMSGVMLVVLLAYLTTLLFELSIPGSEILSRTSPTIIDFGIAVAAGSAAAFANTRRSILSSIAGVAIAVALVPPLAVSGIGVALGSGVTGVAILSFSEFGDFSGGADVASGAFLLFLTNLIGIVGGAIIVFACQRYGEWKKALLMLLLFVVLSAFLIQPLATTFHRLYVKHRVVRLIAKLSLLRPDIVSGRAKLDSIHVIYRDGLLHVNLDGFVPKAALADKTGVTDIEERVDRFKEYLSADIGEPVVVEFDFIPVDMITVSSERSKEQAVEQQADKMEN